MCDKTNKMHHDQGFFFDSVEDTSLTGNIMLAGMSLPEYTQLNNMKGKIGRLEE